MPDLHLNKLGPEKLLTLLSGSFVIRITYTLVGFINSVLLARLLGADSYGVYVFVLSIVALLSVPTQFGLPILMVKEFAALQATKKWGQMRGLALRSHQFVAILATLTCGCAAIWLGMKPNYFSPEKQQALWLGLLLVPILSFGALRDAMLRGLRHVILGQLAESIFRPVLLMLGLLVALSLTTTQSAASVLVLYCACSLLAFVAGWAIFRGFRPETLATATPKFDNAIWLAASIPIALTAGMQVLNAQLSILFLGFYGSDEDVAYFRVAALGAGFVAIFLQVSHSVVSSYFSRLYAQKNIKGIQALLDQANRIIVIATVPLVIAIIALGPWLLTNFYGHAFGTAYTALLLLTAGQAVNALLGTASLLLNMTGHQNELVKAMSLALPTNIILHFLLLPNFGVLGAAFASMLAMMVFNIFLWLKLRKNLGVKYFF